MWLWMQDQISMAHCFPLLIFPAPAIPPMRTEGLLRHGIGPEALGGVDKMQWPYQWAAV